MCSICAAKKRKEVKPLKKGSRFGLLTATGKTKAEWQDHLKKPTTVKYHELKCDCGSIKFYRENYIKKIQSCKSCTPKLTGEKNKTHGKSNTLEYIILMTAKSRAKKRNLEFSINLEDIIVPKLCPIFEIQIDKRTLKNSKRKPLDNSPSLDRIDSSKGYVKGNVAVISYLANSIKNEGNADEHDAVAEFIEKYER